MLLNTSLQSRLFVSGAAAAVLAVACSSGSAPPSGTITDPAALPAPAQGQGVQMKIAAFPVPANTEIQSCYFFKVSDLEAAAGLPADQPIEVHRVQIVQKPGSHHMNVFRVAGAPTRLDPTMGTVHGHERAGCSASSARTGRTGHCSPTRSSRATRTGRTPTASPTSSSPTEMLMLQTHYVNAATQQTPGGAQVAVNLWTLPEESGHRAARHPLRDRPEHPDLREQPDADLSRSGCQFKSATPVTVIGANGHFHSRGKEFDMYPWDGTSTTTPARRGALLPVD